MELLLDYRGSSVKRFAASNVESYEAQRCAIVVQDGKRQLLVNEVVCLHLGGRGSCFEVVPCF